MTNLQKRVERLLEIQHLALKVAESRIELDSNLLDFAYDMALMKRATKSMVNQDHSECVKARQDIDSVSSSKKKWFRYWENTP